VLNVMLPLQVVTGLMIWGRQQLAEPERFGSLAILASVHSLGAWLFCAFLILHLYLITTGHTPASNLKAMITGWDEQDGSEPASAEATQ
jgi:thiosulfate reductase cytochrome b subunit